MSDVKLPLFIDSIEAAVDHVLDRIPGKERPPHHR